MSTPFRLVVPQLLLAEVVAQARQEQPNECCGLLAGVVDGGVGRVVVRYALVNALASPTRFESEPRGLFEAYRDMRRRDVELLAVYHSHPTSPPLPSRIDLEQSCGPNVVNLIVSLTTEPPAVRGWWLTESDYGEAEWAAE